MRLIDADRLKQRMLAQDWKDDTTLQLALQWIYILIDEEPAIEPKCGEWKLYGNDDDSCMSYWCTACNFLLSEDLFYSEYKNGRWIENGVFKYCPNCGAKMTSHETYLRSAPVFGDERERL